MDIEKKILSMSDSDLIRIYKIMNRWEWPEALGHKPEGWDELPHYQKPYMDECKTREDIIRPYILLIRERIPQTKLDAAIQKLHR